MDIKLVLILNIRMEQFSAEFSFVESEKLIQKFWETIDLYLKIVEKNRKGPEFNFTDGPPFVSSDSLHMGHMLISYGKSTNNNFLQMLGYNVLNKIGYDCHGLPIE